MKGISLWLSLVFTSEGNLIHLTCSTITTCQYLTKILLMTLTTPRHSLLTMILNVKHYYAALLIHKSVDNYEGFFFVFL